MSDLQWAAAFMLTVLAGTRLTRLLVFDVYPPVMWLRRHWQTRLLNCVHCSAPWACLAIGGPGYLFGFPALWWLVTAWLGASWISATLVDQLEPR